MPVAFRIHRSFTYRTPRNCLSQCQLSFGNSFVSLGFARTFATSKKKTNEESKTKQSPTGKGLAAKGLKTTEKTKLQTETPPKPMIAPASNSQKETKPDP